MYKDPDHYGVEQEDLLFLGLFIRHGLVVREFLL